LDTHPQKQTRVNAHNTSRDKRGGLGIRTLTLGGSLRQSRTMDRGKEKVRGSPRSAYTSQVMFTPLTTYAGAPGVRYPLRIVSEQNVDARISVDAPHLIVRVSPLARTVVPSSHPPLPSTMRYRGHCKLKRKKKRIRFKTYTRVLELVRAPMAGGTRAPWRGEERRKSRTA
jgi:hypothetical protein